MKRKQGGGGRKNLKDGGVSCFLIDAMCFQVFVFMTFKMQSMGEG